MEPLRNLYAVIMTPYDEFTIAESLQLEAENISLPKSGELFRLLHEY